MKLLGSIGRLARHAVAAAGLLSVAWACADEAPVWLAVTEGGPQAAEVVLVAANRITVFDTDRMMLIRVSRAQSRQGYDGAPYRSFEARVQVDCQARTAGYNTLRWYKGPNWTGATRDISYGADAQPKMAFNDMQPNPSNRIIDAACQLGRVQSTNR